MIVAPKTDHERQTMQAFMLFHAGVQPSADAQYIGWVAEGKLVIAVGFTGFLGKVCQIHIAFAPGWHFSPKAMLREVFRYAFHTAGREMLLGIVNSKNERAMRFDLHLGFREIHRLPGMHEEGGDLVVLAMKKSECRYLNEPDAVELAEAGSA